MKNAAQSVNEAIRKMLSERKKPKEIMEALGVTRGQIAGVRHRSKPKVEAGLASLDRAEDEDILRAVKLRAAGLSPAKIANIMHRETAWVHNVTFAVQRDDLELSGDKPGAVRGGYW